MRNLWLMARHEYMRLATRRTFILSTLGFPLLIALAMGLGFLLGSRAEAASLGYVDLAGVIDPLVQPTEESETSILAFKSEEAARAALASEEIDGFYVIPADYRENQHTQLYFGEDPPGNGAQRDFARLLRANLVVDLPESVQQRLIEGTEVTVRSADGSRTLGTGNVFGFLLPFLAAMLFIIAVMTSAGYLLQVVAEEKENRTMEILVTTMHPMALIGGKSLGLMVLALTQIAIWVAAIVVALIVGSQFWTFLQGISVPWQLIGLVAIFFVPSYALIAGLMTAIGAAVTEVRQGQQVAGMLNLLFVVPLFVLPILLEAPNGPVAIGFTLFPTTSFITVTLRWAIGSIPLWQLLASWGILVLSAVLSVWLSARIFRVGMLRYGQPLSFRTVLATLQGR
jgi:ABC-2 type transport system permease protein